VPDPHAWQDPRYGIIYSDNIARGLAAVDPAHADAYRQRCQTYKAELEALDRQVRNTAALKQGMLKN
jgi:zinc/manganese transport system substrate-binding protein